ncbi:MAG TPA: hypothetical protein VFJ60_06805, partial [Gaiella sp.]|nr:hypothetical protein [Gaiella sp.]
MTLTANITDDLSGVVEGCTQGGIESLPTGQIAAGGFYRVSGDTYAATLTLPQNAAAGTWTLRYLTVCDNAGNSRFMAAGNSDLPFTVTLNIVSVSDTSPPSVNSLSLSPASVDVSSGPATVTLTANITDDLSGVVEGCTQGGI